MTYASIAEVWGSVSGSNQLNTPLPMHQRMHPIHEKRIQEEKNKVPSWKTQADLYQCNYGTHKCNEVFRQNQNYNNQKKEVAQGTQPFLPPSQFYPGSPPPQNYTFLPQYPWYPWAKYGYLTYPPGVSANWYGDPWNYNPYVANQIQNYQMMHPPQYMTQIQVPYQPNGFLPINNVQPPLSNNKKEAFTNMMSRHEHFSQDQIIKTGLIFFIFFLVALAVILCIFLICMTQIGKK